MVISIASGKGGTGKTTIAVNLALLFSKGTVQLIDCDVEEPNAHLFLNPSFHEVTSVGIQVPRIDESSGDFIRVYLKVEDGRISAFKFLTQGYPGAISTSSIATELAIGNTLEEALKLTDNDVIEAAAGIPARKTHCRILAIRELHEVIVHYREKQAEESKRSQQ